MKQNIYKSILFSLLISGSISGICQITITSANMPSANDTIRYSVVQNSAGVDFKVTGANKAWDFKSLKPTSQDIYSYKNSASTPYIFNFGIGVIGLKVADSIGTGQASFKDVYSFFKKSTTKWEAVGIGFKLNALPLPQAGKHTNNDEIYTFPLNFSDRDSTAFALKVPIAVIVPLGNYFQDGNRVNTVDGWGKISTPYQSDIECIRIKSVITETDSIAIAITGQAPINFAFPNNRVEYKWLSKTEKIPMLEVTGTEIGGTFTPTVVRFRDNYRLLGAPLAPVADFVSNKTNATTSETVIFTDKSTNSPQSYIWVITPNTFNFVNGTSASSKNPQVQFTATGLYTVKLTATNGAGGNSITKTNYINVGLSGIKPMDNMQLITYPNPAKNLVTIEIPSYINQSAKLFVFDILGKQVENIDFTINENNFINLNTTQFNSGRYSLIISCGNSFHYTSVTILK